MDARTVIAKDKSDVSFRAALRALYLRLPAGRRRHLWLVLFLSLLGGLAELVTIGAIVPFLSVLASTEPSPIAGVDQLLAWIGGSSRNGQLTMATFLFVAAALIAGTIRLLLAWSSQTFVQYAGQDISTEIQRRILAQSYSFHLAHHSSEVIASLALVDQLTFGVILPLIQATAGTIITLFVLVAIAIIDLQTAAIAAAAFAAAYSAIILFFRRRLEIRSKVIAAAYGERVRLVQESIGGIRDVIVDQAQAAHVGAFTKVEERLTRARVETILANVAPRFLVESIGLVILALVALALSQTSGDLASALPIIGALALGAQRLLPLANQLYQGWSLAAANRAIAARIVDLLELPAGDATTTADSLPLIETIEFLDVSFTYPGRKKPALDRVSFAIPRGRRVALSGATGSGKSSLADLLMSLIEPSAGAITIDGARLDAKNRAAWRRSIAHVPQSIFLIDASIARNIALSVPGEELNRARALAAAKIAQLGEFIDTLPDGIDTVVGERGVRLSGGQRQRIGIARAVYKQAPMLILDEATSALDEDTEAAVMAALEKIPGLTMLVIAHRRSTIDRCDAELHLDHGRLA